MPMTPSGTRPTWMLPAELAHPDEPFRRTPRDWIIDLTLMSLATLVWMLFALMSLLGEDLQVLEWMLWADLLAGIGLIVAMWWRRRFPLILLWGSVPLLYFSGSGSVAIAVLVFSAAIHRPAKPVAVAVLVHILVGISFPFVVPQPEGQLPWVTVLVIVMFYLVFMLSGMLARSHRQVVVGMREQARRDRIEQEQRLANVRTNERQTIAREMHDVLAHRLSMLSVHAGGLAYRSKRASEGGKPLTEDELVETVTLIGDNARQALSELADILHVLRDDNNGDSFNASGAQAKLAELPALIEEAKESGQDVRFYMTLSEAESLRPQLQRTLYRTVQEGLTNARKHAPGSTVTVSVSADSTSVVATVANPLTPGVTASEIPGANTGLTGLAERVELEGGQLNFGISDGRYRLAVALPLNRD
ncbi:histidine kinase [Natronoglycomyces albus]|uniref:histidine kinase n=1 Tax=Natronoglycomyces albus TaxID=2811108 RepID=A0A895XU78_9ACTN|nr:histidine kinase [Natronoglycomyces albus]QSB06849.1 hypothetical protein JQS30_08180 [Natronoglycomyces albus]